MSFWGIQLSGQTVVGQVVARDTALSLSEVSVRLIDPAGLTRAAAMSDSAGHYELRAPGIGPYAVVANRLGRVPSYSPMFQINSVDDLITVDLELGLRPLEVEGVTATGRRRVDQRLRESIGLNTDALMTPPILREERERRAPDARTVGQAVLDLRIPFIVTTLGLEGPCFRLHGRGGLTVYMDGVEITRDMTEHISLDLVEAIVVLRAGESVLYRLEPALLLFTRPWLR